MRPDFEIRTLGEIALLKMGGTPSTSDDTYWEAGDVLWATPGDLGRGEVLCVHDTARKITAAGLASRNTALFPAGTVLLSTTATIGNVGLATRPLYCNQQITAIIPDKCVLPEYLAYWFLRSKYELMRLGGTSTATHINQKNLATLRIPIPSLPEQSRIVDLLLRAEGIVRLRKEAQEKAAELIPAIFVDLFGDPNHNPQGLPSARVEDLCDLVRGSSPRPQGDARFFGGPVPRLMIADITRDGTYVTPRIDSLTIEGATKSRPMNAGDVVMAVSGAVGLPAILVVDSCIHDGFVGFRALNSKVTPAFFYNYLVAIRSRSSRQAVGATFQNLNTAQIRAWSVPIPSMNSQAVFQQRVDLVNGIHIQQRAAAARASDAFNGLLAKSFSN